jgi:hypothetical protein
MLLTQRSVIAAGIDGAAVAAAHDADTPGVDVASPPDERERGPHVLPVLAAPRAADRLAEVAAVSLAAPRIREEDGVSGCREALELVEEGVPVLGVRPAVDLEDRGRSARGRHAGRAQFPHLDLRAVGGLDPMLDRGCEMSRGDEPGVRVGQRRDADRRCCDVADGDLVGRGHVADGEGHSATVGGKVAHREFDALRACEARRGAVDRHRGDSAGALPAHSGEQAPPVSAPGDARGERRFAAVRERGREQAPVGRCEQIAKPAATVGSADEQTEVPRGVQPVLAILATREGQHPPVGTEADGGLRADRRLGDLGPSSGRHVDQQQVGLPRIEDRGGRRVRGDGEGAAVGRDVEGELAEAIAVEERADRPGREIEMLDDEAVRHEVPVAVEAVPGILDDARRI